MNLLEEAVIYATVMHSGETRKGTSIPYIIHPMEVAQILSTMTDDPEIITAGVLHDVVEDTDGTLEEIRKRFGDRVAKLVESETENKYKGESKEQSWKKRKEESLLVLKNADSIDVKMLWLADKLSNLRSMAQKYAETGEEVWQLFHQKDPQMHRWYYKSIAQILEIDLNRTGAFKELIEHINFIWPGTFSQEKAYFKKYNNVSLEGLKLIGRGSKSDVYRYDEELIVKVYNEKNMFKDIEREYALTKTALKAGIPTAIPFGVVTIGDKYGSLFELVNSESISSLIKRDPDSVDKYAKVMADLAKEIHSTEVAGLNLPNCMHEVHRWIEGGIRYVDESRADKVREMLDALPKASTMIHGDFHTGNVMCQNGEYLLIDMARLAAGNPVIELSGVYMFYIAFGEQDPSFVEHFMGFPYETAKKFFDLFMHYYFEGKDENEIGQIKRKCALLAYVRLVRRCYKKGTRLSKADKAACAFYMGRINELMDTVSDFCI